MPNEALYYPYIEVPEAAWFARALLYWDAISSIVPRGLHESRNLSPGMLKLMDVGLVRAVYPDEYVWRIPRFEEDFLALLDRDPSFSSTHSMPPDRVHVDKLSIVRSTVHREKFNSPLLKELRRRGLARKTHSRLVMIEHTTAELFMAYLAARLCELAELAMDPVTGRSELLAPFATELPGKLGQARHEVLDVALPFPRSSDLTARKLAKFKERHHDALRSFRHLIESSLLDVALIENEDVRRRKLDQLKEEIATQVEELTARIQERGWRTDPTATVLQVLSPAGAPAVALLTGHPALAAGGVPGVLLAGYLAGRRSKSALRSSPLAFAALMETELS